MKNGTVRINYQRFLKIGSVAAFWMRLLSDVGSIALAWWLAYWMSHDILEWQVTDITTDKWPLTFLTVGITYYLIFKYNRLYEPRHFLSGSGDPTALFRACVVGFIIAIFILYNLNLFYISRKFTLLFFLFSLVFIHFLRFVIALVGKWFHLKGVANRRVLIVGDNETSRGLFRRLYSHPEEGWVPLGIIPVNGDESVKDGIRRYRNQYRLREYVERGSINEVILCLPESSPAQIFVYFKQLAGLPISISILSKCLRILWEKLPLFIEEYADLPVVHFGTGKPSIWRLWVKRLIDILFSLSVLVLGSPVWLWISWMIKREDGGPALFSQERVRRIGKTFMLYKYRTMVTDAEKLKMKLEEQSFINGPMFKIKDDPRITKIGKLLRKFSLDEIPQFINILKGEMSVVGPRPPLPAEVTDYEDWHKYRIEGWVGLTGLWQICGRNQLQFEEVVLFDVYYLHNFSISLDIQIMLLTVNVVLSPKGSY